MSEERDAEASGSGQELGLSPPPQPFDIAKQGGMHQIRTEGSETHAQFGGLETETEGETTRNALTAARAEVEAARLEARVKVEEVIEEAARVVSQVRLQADNARLEMLHEIARSNAYNRALLAHSAAIESSAFWRLTKPARRALEALPWLHFPARAVVRSAYRIAKGIWRQRQDTPLPALQPTLPCAAITEVASDEAPEQRLLFNELHGLITVPLPEDARRCLIVPFETVPLVATVPRIAVMIHVFYPQQLCRVLQLINRIPGLPALFVTTDTDEKRTQIEAELAGWNGRREIRVVPNRGRDIGSKLVGLADIYAAYDLVLCLHTKRSSYVEQGIEWFNYLLKTLVGSEQVVHSILATFVAQPKLGLLFADHWEPIRSLLGWAFNYRIALDLATRMGFSLSRDQPLDFPSGSMFWARPAALAPLLGLRLRYDDFPEETGQIDGTAAHAIERLFLHCCEHAGYSWARLAHAELFRGEETRAVRVNSIEALSVTLRRHPVMIADPALRASARTLAGRPETWPIRIAPEFVERPRVNLLVPTFDAATNFGGIAVSQALFERTADALGPQFERRIIITAEDHPIPSPELPEGWSLVAPIDPSGDRNVVWLPRVARSDHGLPVRAYDVFFATAWWDSTAAYGLMDLQRSFFGCASRLRYIIQEFEPNLLAWSASWVLAEQTYHRPHDTVAIMDSQLLAEYFERLQLRFAERHIIERLWNKGLDPIDRSDSERENLLLVYWQPNDEHTLGPILLAGLALWLEENPYSTQHWGIVGVGHDDDDVRLTEWRSIKSMGKLTPLQYRALLRRAKVGLAMTLSPHPSYVALEMAAFGLRVVTSDFFPNALTGHGGRIESLTDPTPNTIAGALRRATKAWVFGGPSDTYDADAHFATEAQLDVLVATLARGIRTECPL
jgi:hypothetical protein